MPGRRSRSTTRAAAALAAATGLLLLTLGALAGPAQAQGEGGILVTTVRGVVTPVIADHLLETTRRAESEGYGALLVEMDTPGGLDTAMRDIIQTFLNARVPVIVHVAPQGARAASAGALITMSAHVAAMSPGTSIGAATPIAGDTGEDLERKIIEDAASFAESIAEQRGRNVDFAIAAVREGRSVSASEALELGVVDLLAADRASLLAAADGFEVELATGETVRLHTRGALVEEAQMGWIRSLLQWLSDPNLAFLFISIGTLAIIYELANPGFGGGAIVGVILLVLAFTALAVFPVNAAGILLLVLAAALFVAELFAPGIGVFAAGGTVALILGGLFLFRGPVGVDPIVLVPTAAVAGGLAVLLGRVAWRSRRAVSVSGTGAIVGHRGRVHSVEDGVAQVFLQGSWWKARPATGTLEAGQSVRVLDMEGLELIVEPESHETPESPKEGSP